MEVASSLESALPSRNEITGEERKVLHRTDWPATRARLLRAKRPFWLRPKMVDRCTRKEERPRESPVPGWGDRQCLVVQCGWRAPHAQQRAWAEGVAGGGDKQPNSGVVAFCVGEWQGWGIVCGSGAQPGAREGLESE